MGNVADNVQKLKARIVSIEHCSRDLSQFSVVIRYRKQDGSEGTTEALIPYAKLHTFSRFQKALSEETSNYMSRPLLLPLIPQQSWEDILVELRVVDRE